jgi:hypothetical protein
LLRASFSMTLVEEASNPSQRLSLVFRLVRCSPLSILLIASRILTLTSLVLFNPEVIRLALVVFARAPRRPYRPGHFGLTTSLSTSMNSCVAFHHKKGHASNPPEVAEHNLGRNRTSVIRADFGCSLVVVELHLKCTISVVFEPS